MSDTHTCKYCKKAFKQLSTIAVHVCEPKRRDMARNEKHVKLGYKAFVRFFELTDHVPIKSYEEFAKSPFYNAFCKFGSFVSNTNPLYPSKFIDWVVRSGTKLDKWCDDKLYYAYVLQLIQTESVETALERGIIHMQSWATENKSEWVYYFKEVSIHRFLYDIQDGKISPWLILNSPTGQEKLTNLTDEQLDSIGSIINPSFWVKRFKLRPADTELVRTVVKESSL